MYTCACVCVCARPSVSLYTTSTQYSWCNYHPHTLSLSLSSPCGKKFRSKPQIAKFLGENHNLDLSCFDFSRGAYGEVTQRRRARDRQISTKKMESVKPIPVVKPLSVNPLRATGPIRRTCGVIKLPVTWVAPPDDDQGGTNLNSLTPNDQKSQIHLIVQSLWEKRLFGVKPYDHVTGDEIAAVDSSNDKVEVKPITPIVNKPRSPRTISPAPAFSHSQGSGGGTIPIKPMPSIVPATPFRQQNQQQQGLGGGVKNTSPLLPALLQTVTQGKIRDHLSPDRTLAPSTTPNISVIQQTGQPIIVPQPTATQQQSYPIPSSHQRLTSTTLHHPYPPATQISNGITSTTTSKPPVAPVAPMVTDRELQLQEERVRILRQQLLAAAATGSHRPS